jgi:adenylate cyclase
VETAQTGIRVDEADAWAHWGLALCYLSQKRPEQALAELERALALNPNDADVRADLGWTLHCAGKSLAGIEEIKKAMRLNPYYPGWYLWELGMALYAARQYEEAAEALEAFNEHTVQSRLFLAASYVQLGRSAEAKQQVAEALKLAPGYTLERAAAPEVYQNPADLEHYLDGLRKAGLTEAQASADRA